MGRVVTGGEAQLIMNLSYNIRYAIRDKKTSGAAIARKAGISKSKLYSYTNGTPVLDYAVVKKIADALECTVHDLTKEYDPSMPDSKD
jgi:transcriptional regulator with XRE-family HTH domain